MAQQNYGATSQGIEHTEHAVETLKLRRQGYTYLEIAEKQGINERTAQNRVNRLLSRFPVEHVNEVRAMEVDRYDRMLRAIWDDVLDGDLPAIDRALAISDRRRKLLGVDAPQKHQVRNEHVVFTLDVGDKDVKDAEVVEDEELEGKST